MTAVSHIRNVAIIAHIDHGKTTLIDAIFRAAHTFRENARVAERVMDSNVLERERGITIRAKHCTVTWRDHRINIIDTPGHADFSGEVERVLSMVDSVLLLVDAKEGPMPQTRYVLMRALKLGYRPILIINKADLVDADAHRALNETFDLFLELGAHDHQADFPVLYASALEGWVVRDLEHDPREGMDALFETILRDVPAPRVRRDAPFRMQVCTLAWSEYIGTIGCGRVLEGVHRAGDLLVRTGCRWRDHRREGDAWDVVNTETARSTHLWTTVGLEREPVDEVSAGDIVWLAGPEHIEIGDTLSAPELANPALPPLDIEEPTVSMFFLVNTGPFAGNEGRPVTLRQLKERLDRELHVNAALRVEDLGRSDGVKVSGRGELHLAILVEEMRREGLELCVSRPEVITRRDDRGGLLEPMETLVIDVPNELQGVIIEKLAGRKGQMLHVHNSGHGTIRMTYAIPTRGLIGYRGEFLTDTRGLGIMTSRYSGHGPWTGEMTSRNRGSMVSTHTGAAAVYSLENLQQRGTLFVGPMEDVYAGMIVGEHCRANDLPCNPTKKRHLSAHRSATREIDVRLDVPRRLLLEPALEWIADDELVEVTPKSIRLRKGVLDADDRRRAERADLAA
ncbi:MAG TPA: translational GTPase TypA, partial [Planctomycetota bacterium]|nr:translational GTPase TypA [Planctomycetota bacterium]